MAINEGTAGKWGRAVAGLGRWLLAVGILVAMVGALIWYVSRAPMVSVAVLGHPLAIYRRDLAHSRAEVERLAQILVERRLVLAAEADRWTYTAAELGLTVAPDELLAAIIGQLQESHWAPGPLLAPIPVRLDQNQLEAALGPLRGALEIEPQDAALHLENGMPVVEPHGVGRRIDRQRLADALVRWLQEGGTAPSVTVPVADALPAITATTVEQMGVRRLIAEATTQYDPTIPRAENVQRAAAAFDGMVLKPGQILSYTGVVGPIGAETGWKEAYVIVNGELVTGVGGGVCQVASTFYGAVLRAGFEVLERHPHQLAVAYVQPGLDAAVAPGFEDLKVRNTTPGHVLIRTEAVGGRVTVRLYGDLPADTAIQVESSVLGRIPFETVEVADATLPQGERVVKSWGADGYEAEAYRLTYVGSTLIRRELLSRDTYRPSRQVELVGR